MELTLLNKELLWTSFSDQSTLSEKEVHIFRIAISQYYPEIEHLYKDVLSVEECTKSMRFRKTEDTERYIVSKYLLRILLAKFIATAPSEIQFEQTANKKPYLKDIEFNVSHSKEYIVIAISPCPIGIDIEFVNKSFNYETILNNCFSIEERNFINNGPDRLLNFYVLWTRKEAILKATGQGLTDRLDQINSLKKSISTAQKDYTVESFMMDRDYILSLARNSAENRFKYWIY